ncbi:hypothetical protein NLG97_g7436 [Lecanicillium saksenae]|uniref:Uncharacterized protein n=1 Tax=Lecanicillium saksenae TaxID=468837 RepID=A0ACC1QNM7_9HYPO|nr:hypothetical protein NLG97_g7436 [Lecanicillium saksenae]
MSSETQSPEPFPFTRLPTELRVRIWEHYCPELLGVTGVLDFFVKPLTLETLEGAKSVHGMAQGPHLARKTRHLRCVLAVHHGSRSLALAACPDRMRVARRNNILGLGEIFFHKRRDVIYLVGFADDAQLPQDLGVDCLVSALAHAGAPPALLRQFQSQMSDDMIHTDVLHWYYPLIPVVEPVSNAVNLAFGYSTTKPFPHVLHMLGRSLLPKLENVFLHLKVDDPQACDLPAKFRWCVSKYSHSDAMERTETGQCTTMAYWPNLVQHADFAKQSLNPGENSELLPKLKDVAYLLGLFGVQTWPMLVCDPATMGDLSNGEYKHIDESYKD